MKILGLDPKWLTYDGRRVGFIFRSPTKPEWWQTCFVECFGHYKGALPPHRHFSPDSQAGIVRASAPGITEYQMCRDGFAWTVAGGIENASFETLTVTPSLDGSAGGLWHGHVTNGEIVGGI